MRLVMMAVIAQIVNYFLSSSDESSSESDEDLILLEMNYRGPIVRIPRVQNYIEDVVYEYTPAQFRQHFRMSQETFYFLLDLIREPISRQQCRRAPYQTGRMTISPEKQLMITLWTTATPDSYRSICEKFDIGKATAWRTVRRVTRAIYNLASDFIRWPTAEKVVEISKGFEAQRKFPKILGAIDGTHIRIAAPAQNPEAYVNRKGYHSIQLQLICNHKMEFLHCYAGQVGSVHDQRVFRLSDVYNYLDDPTKFSDDSHLIGDAAYGIHKNLMVPFKDNGHLTVRQKNYNFCLSSTRMGVERSTSLFKLRWRSMLDRLPMTRTDLIPEYILACCVLHNLCILRNDILDNLILSIEQDDPEPIYAEDCNRNNAGRLEGIQKRNRIVGILPMQNQ